MISEKVSTFLGGEGPDEAELERRRRVKLHVYSANGYHPILQKATNVQVLLDKNDNQIQIRNPLELVTSGFNDISSHLLRRIVFELKKLGCKVALVETPPSPYLQSRNPVLHGIGFRRWMRKISEELDVPFIAIPANNYNKLYNDKYIDASHLSPEGAKIFSKVVFERLRKIGFFGEVAK